MSVAIANLDGWLHANVDSPPTFGPSRDDVTGPLAVLYAAFDGQLDGPPLVGHHRILTWDDARAEKTLMDELAADEGWDGTWWNTDWHPFASDGTGQLLVVDAKSGCVLEFLHDDDARPEIAPDLQRLFTRIWTALQAGVVVYDPVFGIGTPEDAAAYHAALASFQAPPPRQAGRPNAALVLGLVPTFAWVGVGLALEWPVDVTVLGATGVALLMTAVGWKLGWVVFDDTYTRGV